MIKDYSLLFYLTLGERLEAEISGAEDSFQGARQC